MFRATIARPHSSAGSAERPRFYYGGIFALEHAANRVARLDEMTDSLGGAPNEAVFANHQAQVLRARIGLGEHGIGSAHNKSGPFPAELIAQGSPSAQDVLAAAAAYRKPSRYRRRKSALRFLENA